MLHCKLEVDRVRCTPDQLESFLIAWDNVVSGIDSALDSDMMYTLLLEQVQDIRELELDLKIFDKLDERDKTYDALRFLCDDWIQKSRGIKNQRKSHSKSNQHLVVAGAAPRTRTTSSERRRRDGSRGRTKTRHSSKSRSMSRSKSKSPSTRRKSRSPGGKKPCMDFIKGKCTRGAGCKYAHERSGRSPVRTPSPARRGPSPGGSIRRTPIQNHKRPCHSYQATKSCKYGDKCAYSHTMPSAAATPSLGSDKKANDRSANSPAPESFR